MKKSKLYVTALLAAMLAGGIYLSQPASAAKDTKTQSKDAGWHPLFNADLSNASFPKGVWYVKDGVMTATKDRNIFTKIRYENFILDLEFKNDEGTNSGVVVHCSDPNHWIPNSVEVQICDDFAKEWSSKPATWHCAAIFGHLAPTKSMVKKPGEWNHMVITCKGKMIYVKLNGEQVTVMDMTKWTSAKKNPDGSPIPPWLKKPVASLPARGYIGFQGKHAGKPIYFRNIKIKELK